MEFKQKVLLISMGCSFWAIIVSWLSSVDDLSRINHKSEMPGAYISYAMEGPLEQEFESICAILNYALPTGLFGIALLVIIFRHDRAGLGAMILAGGIFLVAYSASMKAASAVESFSPLSMDERVWWM
ncbi:MAG: hypothetical protein P1U86_03565 [Verrucomicrobiales bacterium]|nr:hypothetical protein [Verrucomicrobiales bacterium]